MDEVAIRFLGRIMMSIDFCCLCLVRVGDGCE